MNRRALTRKPARPRHLKDEFIKAIWLLVATIIKSLDAKRIFLSPKSAKAVEAFAEQVRALQECEAKALHLLGEKELGRLLRADKLADKLTLRPVPTNWPTSPEAMEQFTRGHESLAYVITTEHEFLYRSEIAVQLMDFAGSEGTPLDELNMRIAGNLLPEKSSHRNPQQDYLILQKMLATLALAGTYDIPDISLLIALPEKDSQKISYYKATVEARHCFSLGKTLLGTICQVGGLETALDQADYKKALQGGNLLSLLPDDLVNIVKARTRIIQNTLDRIQPIQKELQKAREVVRLKELELIAEGPPVTDDFPSIQTNDDLAQLFNIDAFRKVIQSLPRTSEGMDTLRQADDFIIEQLRAVVQDEVKQRLWPNEKVAGTVGFYITPDHGTYYLRATVAKKNPKNIRQATADETRDHLQKKSSSNVSKQEEPSANLHR